MENANSCFSCDLQTQNSTMISHTRSSTGITIIRWPLWSDFVSEVEAQDFLKCAGIKRNQINFKKTHELPPAVLARYSPLPPAIWIARLIGDGI